MMRGAVRATARGVGVVAVTAVEVTALSVWLGLVGGAAPLSAAAAVGVAALAAGSLVAALLTHLTANGLRAPVPARALAALAGVETLLWVGWLAAIGLTEDPAGVLGAGVALAAGLAVRHAVADNALRGQDPLASPVQRATAGFGLVEAGGATAWFLVVSGAVPVPRWVLSTPVAGFSPSAVVGAGLLAVAVFVRHLLAVRHALRPNQPTGEVGWRSSRGTVRE